MLFQLKRLDRFILKSFVPLLVMTFFIVLFIVLMQFLWKYVDDLVGKGLEISVIGELFFYAGVSMVPMSLPLAILLASLMTFGNLGEKFELTAIKASGISLLRAMMPLIIFISMISVGAFFFQNDVLPRAQVKMWTLLFSMKQKSPEVEIPEGVFYDQIPGYNLFVAKKDRTTGMLYNAMIYDVSHGAENATILMADSANMAFTKDSKYLYLHLYKGEQFENLREQQLADQNVPFRREEFQDKQILIPFDVNFNRMDDGQMRRQYVGKNIAELNHTIDSVAARLDSIGSIYGRELRMQSYGGVRPEVAQPGEGGKTVTILPYRAVKMPASVPDLDSIINAMDPQHAKDIFASAHRQTRMKAEEYQYKVLNMADDQKTLRRHQIELIKKFTLSVACLIFFFIGAPLGAIIRKGGIGTPLVISVMLFLVYYIIDNTGYKMARDGHWPVYLGMWISTAILAPLGVFVTYKAMNDSTLFDKNVYMNLIRKVLGLRRKRSTAFKEIIINDFYTQTALEMLRRVDTDARRVLAWCRRLPMGYKTYWLRGVNTCAVKAVGEDTDALVSYMADCRDKRVVALLEEYPIVDTLWLYHPVRKRWLGITMAAIFPLGILIWGVAQLKLHRLRGEMQTILALNAKESALLVPHEEADSSQEGRDSL